MWIACWLKWQCAAWALDGHGIGSIDHFVNFVQQVGVVHDIRLQELRLFSDAGRCCRPLFIVDNQQLLIKKVCWSLVVWLASCEPAVP
jgi:RNA polymerase Rpb2, domain 4